MKKNGLKNIWLALRRHSGSSFYNPAYSADQAYWNWDHRINPAGPYASLDYISKPDERPEPTWVARGMKDKHPYLCLKSFKVENDLNNPFPALGRPFIGPFGSSYNDTVDKCKTWVKGARYYQADMCMKYFPEKFTFTQDWC